MANLGENVVAMDDYHEEGMNSINNIVETAGVDALTDEEFDQYMAESGMSEHYDKSHYANLVEQIDSTELDRIATQVIEWVDSDENSREDWEKRESKGIRLLGVSDKTDGGANFEGASRVVHPLLAEACSQFNARAIVEMWPAEGPVKTKVLGTPNIMLNEQAERVQDYMNYQYTSLMPSAFEEEDQMLLRLPLSGSCFKKAYYDELEQTVVTALVEPSEFIVPYTASNLRTAPRFTHKIYENHNDVLKKIKIGYYSEPDNLSTPVNEDMDRSQVIDEIDFTEGRHSVQIDEDQRHVQLEMYVDMVIKGFEELGGDGEPNGIAEPYIITVDREDQSVMRIQRNYRPSDLMKKKRIYFTHYKFSPGFGFYGYGLLHLIGGLSNAATGSLRALLDSAAFANQQGGFKTKDSRIKGGDTPISPGEWREVQSSAEELSKGFFALPYKEPSETLFKLLGYIDEAGQRFASTTENMVGEASNQAPVGTTLALIEQGSKVFTAIHKRLHEAHSKEFKIVGELNFDYLPSEGYPYIWGSADRQVMQQDFDGKVDIIPVSDPAIISTTQRITQAQAILSLAETHPTVIDERKAVIKMLEAMRISGYEDLLLPESTESTPEEKNQIALNDKIAAETDKLKVEAVNKAIEGQYSSLQAAQGIVTMPEVVPVADELLLSAGYVDKNGPPLASMPLGGTTFQQEALPPPIEDEMMMPGNPNTNPMTPANPLNPAVGAKAGIETLENDL